MRLLWISDSPTLNTGLAKVTREILSRLTNRWGIEVACVGWFEKSKLPRSAKGPFDIFPGSNPYTVEQVDEALTQFDPDVVVALGDIWMFAWLHELAKDRSIPAIAYLTIDSHSLPAEWLAFIAGIDRVVVCSAFGKSVIQNRLPGIDVAVIPLGADIQAFRPQSDRMRLRARLSATDRLQGQQINFEDRFVVGCVARNQPRKQLPRLIRAFAGFAQDHPDAMLYLHTAPNDMGGSLPDYLLQYDIQAKTVLTPGITFTRGVSERLLNDIYNLFDVFVLPTMGEGFGLPILEAMACGVPIIATDCSAVTELIQGRGELLRVKD